MSSHRLHTAALVTALVAGTALIADVVLITALDRSFGAPDDALFLLGFGGMFVAAALVAVVVARSRRGPLRVGVGAASAAAIVVSLSLASLAADAVSHALYHGGNRGLHGECGIFVLGLGGLALAGALQRRRVPQTSAGQRGVDRCARRSVRGC